MQNDRSNNIETIPFKIGISNSYKLIDIFTYLFFALSIGQCIRQHNWERLPGAAITTIATLCIARYLKNKTGELVYLVLADGLMLLYSLLVIFG